MVEGDDSSLDTAMYVRGNDGGKILKPVRLDDSAWKSVDTEPDPLPDPNFTGLDNNTEPDSSTNTKSSGNRWHYMRQFVMRVGGILQAMQAREALPNPDKCAECIELAGQWRCEDCVGGQLLCRRCMRQSHFVNPFHRIECWTGSYFRKAALWEVGVYLTLFHRDHPRICPNLAWQQHMLSVMQMARDPETSIPSPLSGTSAHWEEKQADSGSANEHSRDEVTMKLLDELLDGQHADDVLEEDDVEHEVDTETDLQDSDAGLPGFVNYIEMVGPEHGSSISAGVSPATAPNRDALNNQYVRVVHTNGIHHIALVCCACHGQDNIIDDLIYGQFVPTSFTRIRTLFTSAVLDHFRYCNLEMKSSAYQFFQMLRRLTNSMNPSSVVNLYHELRRLSRLWRWVKKLRWAGYGQDPGCNVTPGPGDLGNFCPACPQVGVNLLDGWIQDPNRWVFRRFLTADGNFKADHVRQKNPANDIWLSDGLGMTARVQEYNAFLKSAKERNTVSRTLWHMSR